MFISTSTIIIIVLGLSVLALLAVICRVFDTLDTHQSHIDYLGSIQRESPDYQARSTEATRKCLASTD